MASDTHKEEKKPYTGKPKGGFLGGGRKKGTIRYSYAEDAAHQIQRIIPLRVRVLRLKEIAMNGKPAEALKAIEQLNSYHLGKPTERTEVDIKSKQPIAVALIPSPKIEEKK